MQIGLPSCWGSNDVGGFFGAVVLRLGKKEKGAGKLAMKQGLETSERVTFDDVESRLMLAASSGVSPNYQIGRASCRERV